MKVGDVIELDGERREVVDVGPGHCWEQIKIGARHYWQATNTHTVVTTKHKDYVNRARAFSSAASKSAKG